MTIGLIMYIIFVAMHIMALGIAFGKDSSKASAVAASVGTAIQIIFVSLIYFFK